LPDAQALNTTHRVKIPGNSAASELASAAATVEPHVDRPAELFIDDRRRFEPAQVTPLQEDVGTIANGNGRATMFGGTPVKSAIDQLRVAIVGHQHRAALASVTAHKPAALSDQAPASKGNSAATEPGRAAVAELAVVEHDAPAVWRRNTAACTGIATVFEDEAEQSQLAATSLQSQQTAAPFSPKDHVPGRIGDKFDAGRSDERSNVHTGRKPKHRAGFGGLERLSQRVTVCGYVGCRQVQGLHRGAPGARSARPCYNIAMQYDVCVIGAGPAGFAAAMRAWDYGKRVCLVERGPLGGAGVHHGALTSKTLWELSKDYRSALKRDRGFVAENVHVDYQQVIHTVETAVAEKVDQLDRQLRVLSEPGAGFPGSITTIQGNARFLDPHTVCVEGTDPGDIHRIQADHMVIATGSRPRIAPNIPVDGEYVLTSDHLTRLSAFPRSIVIVGAGVIGCEFATILSNFGQTKVYLIDRADRILPFEDYDVANLCATNLEAKGVTIHRGANLEQLHVVDGKVEYTIRHRQGGLETIRVQRALVSIGRVPNTRGLDLEKAGLTLSARGHIADDDTRTEVPHIFAVGDVTLDIALVSIGEIEGRRAIDHIWGEVDRPLSYQNVSMIMFLDPEVAAVGLNEQQAQKQRVPYKVAVYDYSLVNRAIAMRDTQGFVKLLVSNDDTMSLLGIRALGVHASSSIEAVSLLIRQGRSLHDLAELLHPHPAVTEGLQDCVRMLLGRSIMKPHVFTSELRLSAVHYSDSGAIKVDE